MNKGLEALEIVKHGGIGYYPEEFNEAISFIKNALKRLEELELDNQVLKVNEKYWREQATLKGYEANDILRIVKDKELNIKWFLYVAFEKYDMRKDFNECDYYNAIFDEKPYMKLTQQEFDLLKEWLK